MSKLINFSVKTTIEGVIQRELESDDEAELAKVIEEIESEGVSLRDMERDFPGQDIFAETEVLSHSEAAYRAGS